MYIYIYICWPQSPATAHEEARPKAVSPQQAHRWSGNSRPQPQKCSKLVFLTYFTRSCIFLTWCSGALVGVGGSDVIGYEPSERAARRGPAERGRVLKVIFHTKNSQTKNL